MKVIHQVHLLPMRMHMTRGILSGSFRSLSVVVHSATAMNRSAPRLGFRFQAVYDWLKTIKRSGPVNLSTDNHHWSRRQDGCQVVWINAWICSQWQRAQKKSARKDPVRNMEICFPQQQSKADKVVLIWVSYMEELLSFQIKSIGKGCMYSLWVLG